MRNKFLKGVTSLSIAAAICMAFGAVSASAETKTIDPSTSIEIDYWSQKIIVTPNSGAGGNEGGGEGNEGGGGASGASVQAETAKDNQILFGVSTVNAKKNTLKTSAWEVYDVDEDGQVVIDISSLNTQKDNYVQIKGSLSKDPITLHIKPSDKTVKMKFNAATGKVENNKGNEKPGTLEYRTQYSDWAYYGTYEAAAATGETGSDVDLKVYQQRGATLYFRQATTEEVDWTADKTDLVDITNDAKSTTKIADYYDVPALPGKEIKVAVGKKANGPKATVNYLKNTVTIPKGAEYRVNSATALGSWKKDAASAKYEIAGDDLATLLAGGSVDVVKRGDTSKGKADSKYAQVAFNDQAELTATGDALKGAKYDGEIVEVTAVDPVKDKKGNITSYTVKVKNNSSDKTVKYEVVVKTGDDAAKAPAVNGKDKKTAVASGKEVSIKKVAAGASVYIHKVGVAASQTWSTEYVQLGKVEGGSGSDEEDTTKADKELAQKVLDEFFTTPLTIKRPGNTASGVSYPLNVELSGKTITWGSSADYDLTDGSKAEGITISATIVNGAGNASGDGALVLNSGVVQFADRPESGTTYQVKVTVTKEKASVDKTIDITID